MIPTDELLRRAGLVTADGHSPVRIFVPSGAQLNDYRGCLVTPTLVWDAERPALVGLPLRALSDPRGVPLVTPKSALAFFYRRSSSANRRLYCCSDPFDAALVGTRRLGVASAIVAARSDAVDAQLARLLCRIAPQELLIFSASTSAGTRSSESWIAAATVAGLPAQVVELPPGFSLRDLRFVSGDAALDDLLRLGVGWRPPRAIPAVRATGSSMTRLPWRQNTNAQSRDLTDYIGHLQARGHQRAECRRRAQALALLWRFALRLKVQNTRGLGRRHIEEWQRELVATATAALPGRSIGAAIRILTAVKGFLAWLATTERSTSDLSGVLTPIPRPSSAPVLVLSEVEIERVLCGIRLSTDGGRRDRAMLELLYSTGIRRGELVGLDVDDLDFGRAVLRVRRGKGGRSRLVPLGRRAIAWLRQYIEVVRVRHLRDAVERALFVTRNGRRIGVEMVTTRMHQCLKSAGVMKPGSCHIIRHSVATLMHDAGADIRDLQALLAHALLTSTQIYTRVSLQRLHEVHRRTHPAERG